MQSAPAKRRWQVAAYLSPLLVVAALVSGDQLAVYAAPDTVAAPAVLKVEGAVPTPLSLTSEDLAKMPRATVRPEGAYPWRTAKPVASAGAIAAVPGMK